MRTGVGVPAGLVVLDPVASSLPALPSMPLTLQVADAGPAPAVARLAEILRDTIAERTGRPV